MQKQLKRYVMQKIENEFDLLQTSLIQGKPILGATRWFLLDTIIEDDDNIILIMEDGHILHYVVLCYHEATDSFSIKCESSDYPIFCE